jgi:hypothetical protein
MECRSVGVSARRRQGSDLPFSRRQRWQHAMTRMQSGAASATVAARGGRRGLLRGVVVGTGRSRSVRVGRRGCVPGVGGGGRCRWGSGPVARLSRGGRRVAGVVPRRPCMEQTGRSRSCCRRDAHSSPSLLVANHPGFVGTGQGPRPSERRFLSERSMVIWVIPEAPTS